MQGFKDAVAKKTRRVGGRWLGPGRVCGVDWGRWTTAPNNRPERSHRQPIRFAPPQIMRARTGPSLPQSLLEEISGQAGAYECTLDSLSLIEAVDRADDSHRRRQKGGRQLSRKEARKQEREGRKQRKTQSYASYGAPKPPPFKRAADHEHPDSPQRKKAKLSQPVSNATVSHVSVKSNKTAKPVKAPGAPRSVPDRETPLERASRRAESTLKTAKAKSIASAVPVVLRSHQEEEDDAYIAYLESKLGYRKGGQRTTKYGKGGDDGLDGAQYSPCG